MKTNPLGDIRAEHDHAMLDRVFYETPEYRSLLEEHTRRIVVGRRGTGKSALFYKLQRHWSAAKTTTVVLTPSETDFIGLRPFVSLFGEKPSYLRAACSLAWQYALLQEILTQLSDHYKVRSGTEFRELADLARLWRQGGGSLTSRLFRVLERKVDKTLPVESRVATLAQSLQLNDLTNLAKKALDLSRQNVHLHKDRELPWVREIYHEHDRRVIVKLPAKLIVSWLSKLRNPQKHDAPDKGLGSLLDTYERMYLRLGGSATPEKRNTRKKRSD